MLMEIISLIIGGLGIGGLIMFFVNRHDSKKGLESKLYKVEKDCVRTQILLMMYNYDKADEHEFLTVCEYYFKEKDKGGLEADWYLSSLFAKHCEKWGIDLALLPWFKQQ